MYERREMVRNVVQTEIEVENYSEGRLVGEEVITGAEQSGPTTPWYLPLLSGCCGFVPLPSIPTTRAPTWVGDKCIRWGMDRALADWITQEETTLYIL